MKKKAKPERTWINVAMPRATHARLKRAAGRIGMSRGGSRVPLGDVVALALGRLGWR